MLILYVKGVIVSIMGCLAAAEGTIAASARKLVSTINHISVLFWYSEQQINLTSLLNLWTGLLFWWYVWQKVETTVNCKQNGSVSGGHGWLAEVNGYTGGGWGVPWLGVPLCHYSQHCQCGAHHQHNFMLISHHFECTSFFWIERVFSSRKLRIVFQGCSFWTTQHG